MKDATRKQATVPCETCKEEILLGAEKCIHCESYQDWRGKLTFSSTVLSLLVALVSVLGFTGPIFKDLLTPHNSRLEVVGALKVQDNIIRVIVRNNGTRTGVVDHADAIITAAKGDHVTARMSMRQIESTGQLDSSLVLPGTMKELKFTPEDKAKKYFELLDAAVDKKCNLHLFLTEFDGTKKELKDFPLGCSLQVGSYREMH